MRPILAVVAVLVSAFAPSVLRRDRSVLAAVPHVAQKPADARFEPLAALVQDKMREYRIPGVALGIVANGVTTVRGFGVTSVEDPLPITTHTVFPIASISKTFAATALMRLVEQGKVDLRAPVRSYLSDFRVQDEAVSREVTIWHLLTHSSGWEGQVSGPDRGEETLKNFVSTLGGLMQLAPPGAAWSYNNAGFSVAGRVIETVTGTSINAAIRDLVFKPLGLAHAGTTAGDFIANRFAVGHLNRADNPPALQRPFAPATSVTAGGVGVCIEDLLTYARFHLGDGRAASGERDALKGGNRTPADTSNFAPDAIVSRGIALELRLEKDLLNPGRIPIVVTKEAPDGETAGLSIPDPCITHHTLGPRRTPAAGEWHRRD
jgi:CubicO group peptidase (beta-lactamase class C family)